MAFYRSMTHTHPHTHTHKHTHTHTHTHITQLHAHTHTHTHTHPHTNTDTGGVTCEESSPCDSSPQRWQRPLVLSYNFSPLVLFLHISQNVCSCLFRSCAKWKWKSWELRVEMTSEDSKTKGAKHTHTHTYRVGSNLPTMRTIFTLCLHFIFYSFF